MQLPDLNNRIRKVIEDKTNGSVRRFAEQAGISQQKINRLFNIDTRTQKIPSVPSDILIRITEMFVDVNPRWLLTGKETMYLSHDNGSQSESEIKYEKPALEMIRDLAAENALLKKENKELRRELNNGYGNIAAEP